MVALDPGSLKPLLLARPMVHSKFPKVFLCLVQLTDLLSTAICIWVAATTGSDSTSFTEPQSWKMRFSLS